MLMHTVNAPDILEVIADLSNDEVFTPPRVANAVLDLLPPDVWTDPGLRWLDPGSKTGVFLREITRRLMVGLADHYPDERERLVHILNTQVFGIAVTELTALMSRRTLYCSKTADGPKAVVKMPSPAGNIWFGRIPHSYVRGRCIECAASEEEMERSGRENYAYALIHAAGRHQLREEITMKFDVIVGNPPYQMTGGGGGTNDTPLYNMFVEQAMALDPRYVSMIMPSRWMAGGRNLDTFRETMLTDRRVRVLVDYENAKDLFPSVGIHGGVCYFLWDRDNPGPCESTYHRNGATIGPTPRQLDEFDILVRDPRALGVLRRVLAAGEPSCADLVSGDTPFGLATNFKDYQAGASPQAYQVLLYANNGTTRVRGALDRQLISKNVHLIDVWKCCFRSLAPGASANATGTTLCSGPRSSLPQARRAPRRTSWPGHWTPSWPQRVSTATSERALPGSWCRCANPHSTSSGACTAGSRSNRGTDGGQTSSSTASTASPTKNRRTSPR